MDRKGGLLHDSPETGQNPKPVVLVHLLQALNIQRVEEVFIQSINQVFTGLGEEEGQDCLLKNVQQRLELVVVTTY